MILVVRLKCKSKRAAYKNALNKKKYLKNINPLKDISSTMRHTRINNKFRSFSPIHFKVTVPEFGHKLYLQCI